MCPLELYPFPGLKLDLGSFVKKKIKKILKHRIDTWSEGSSEYSAATFFYLVKTLQLQFRGLISFHLARMSCMVAFFYTW